MNKLSFYLPNNTLPLLCEIPIWSALSDVIIVTDTVAYTFETNEKMSSAIQFDRSFFREFEKNCILKIQWMGETLTSI